MNLNLFLVSFSVFYTKYNYCYEVPEDMPLRYFDGTVWKIMKAREQVRIVTSRPNISIELDWPESSHECNKKENIENTKTENKTTIFKKIFRATTKRIPTKQVTKKVTHKATTKVTTTKCNCILKKMTTYEGYPRAMKTTTKIPNLRTTKRPAKTTKKFVKTIKKPPARASKKPPAKIPAILAKHTAKSTGNNGSLKEQRALPENWVNIIKDLVDALKSVEAKNNNNNCGTQCTSKLNSLYPLADGRRAMDGVDDIMNLLLDGVEIDDSPDYLNGNHSDYSLLPGFRGLTENQDTVLDINEIEKYFPTSDLKTMSNKDLKLNENNIQHLDLESIKDAIKARYVKYSDGKSLQNSEVKEYLDSLKSRYTKKEIQQVDDAPLNLAAINAVIETKHPENPEFREDAEYKDTFKESDLKTYLDAKSFSGSSQNKAIKAYLDILKSKHIARDTSYKGDTSLDFEALDRTVETHTPNDPGFRELVEYNDKALELNLKSYLDEMNGRYTTKDTKINDNTLDLKEVMTTRHPDTSELKEQEISQDDFQGIDLRPYLNAMDARYAAKSQDRSQDIYAIKNKDTPETTSLNLDEIVALIASKQTNNTNTTKQIKNKKHLKDRDVKNFFDAMTSFQFTKDKKLRNRDRSLDLDDIAKNEDNLNAIGHTDEDKHKHATDVEENGLATDDKSEQKETDIKNEGLEDADWLGPNFKYILDDGEQNEIREDNAFTWGDDGELFLSPELRPTLAP